jgi:hypothetical protein
VTGSLRVARRRGSQKRKLAERNRAHWPTVAPVGYANNREIHRIEVDPARAPPIAQLFKVSRSSTGTADMLARNDPDRRGRRTHA